MLFQFFGNYFPLDKASKEAAAKVFNLRSYKRKGLLLQEGDICKTYSFVVSGCFKMYAVDANGSEHNLQFAVEKEWVADFKSFYAQEPSHLYIEAIEPSAVLQVAHDDLLALYTNFPKFDRNFRIIIERRYIELQDRVQQNISVTAEERYRLFENQYPKLIQRLPGTQIASYLGITSEFLSKIKKKLARS
ncbi:MAG: Crp/Fnr family transcriptional regulator [Chryseobacterium sp.]|nr:MAG: Crp/Fnr family transcriptional regulator [Chryseobacterium sp.]